jgi:hypothetical protein
MCLAVRPSFNTTEDAMRNDARPIGEEFRDVAEHNDQPAPETRPEERATAERGREEKTPFVVKRDPADEELPPGTSER